MNLSLARSLSTLALLTAIVGCEAPAALFGTKESKNPLGENALLADKRSPLEKAMSSVFGQDKKKQATAKVPKKKSDATSLANRSKPSPGFWVTLARIAERSGNHASATAHYQRALQLDSGHLDALLGYARLHDRKGDFPEAVRRYEQAVHKHPRSSTAHNDFALCLMRKGDASRAAAMLSKAVELEPGKPLYRNNLGAILAQMGREEQAWHHLAAVHPPAVAHYNLGFLLKQQGQLPAARKHFALALERDANLVAARHSLGEIDARMRSVAQAQPPAVQHQQGNPRYGGPGSK